MCHVTYFLANLKNVHLCLVFLPQLKLERSECQECRLFSRGIQQHMSFNVITWKYFHSAACPWAQEPHFLCGSIYSSVLYKPKRSLKTQYAAHYTPRPFNTFIGCCKKNKTVTFLSHSCIETMTKQVLIPSKVTIYTPKSMLIYVICQLEAIPKTNKC